MRKEYKTKMAHAENCEHVIAKFREGDDSTKPNRLNFASKTQLEWMDVVRSYQDAFEVYRDLKQPEKAKTLFGNLIDLVKTCDEFTSSLAIQLLFTLINSYKWMEQVSPGTQDQFKSVLSTAIDQKLLQKEIEFWLLRNAYTLLRDLASDDLERKKVNISLCQVLELGAQIGFRRGNLDIAEGWFRDAARIAQERVGNPKWANHLLQQAGYIQKKRAERLPSSAFVQAVQSETPSSHEFVEANDQMDINEDLDVILHKAIKEQHSERFLISVDELIADYESEEDKLSKLLSDERLLLNNSKIEEREAKYCEKGLLGWIPSQFVDSQGNPRGDFDANDRFTVQYVAEIAEAVEAFFKIWQEEGYLKASLISNQLSQLSSSYDWRIYKEGLSRHFQADFVSAIHTLIPQFENIVRMSAQGVGVDIKKYKSGVPGDVLLNYLINPNNNKMRELLGEGLFDLVYWYLVNSASPFGYRHKIAHGWIQPDDCDIKLSSMIIWLTLKVINTFAQAKASEQQLVL